MRVLSHVGFVVIELLFMTLTSNARRAVIVENGRDIVQMESDSSYCISPVTSDQPDCKVNFREDSGWTNQFNATCIKPNVFLVPYNRTSKLGASLMDTRRSYAVPNDDSFLPPYVRFTCVANYAMDFEFVGNGAIEFLRVWKSVSYVNDGTDTFESQTLNVELLLVPSATGHFVFHSTETSPLRDTSFFIFAEPPEDGPFLVTPGEGGTPLPAECNMGNNSCNIPCIVSNRVAKLQLFQLREDNWNLVGNSEQNTSQLTYIPEIGFTLSGTPDFNISATKFQCREENAVNSVLNFTVLPNNTAESSSGVIIPNAQLLEITVDAAATCSAPESEGPLRFFNVFVRNPTESYIVADCLLRGMEHCGEESIYHKRINGINCPGNQTSRICSRIPAAVLHREGLLVCKGKTQFRTREYFRGFDGMIYSDPKRAPPIALLKVKVTQSGISTFSNPSPTELVTGVRYEIKCNSVEFPFVKESQLLFVKYRNGTQELLAELVWWKSGKEMYLKPEMVELECRDRLWTNNELFNSSTTIDVTDRNCTSEQFRCKSGQCIRDSWRCDGDNDCMDSTDEANCHVHVCKPEFYKCLSGQCIALEKRCNNKRECPDGSDESFETCSNVTCNAVSDFKCQSGQCVLAQFLCDGDFDCYDKSDESQTNCARYFPTIVSTHQNLTMVEGLQGELVCDTVPLPAKLQPRIEWWRHNANITDTSRLWRNVDGSKLALKFTNANELDAGDYTCFTENSLSRSFLTFHVKVISKDFTSDEPVSGSKDFLCDYELDQEDCFLKLCKAHPRLTFCKTQNDYQSENQVSKHSGGLPLWVTLIGTFLILVIVVAPAIYIWKRYRPSNLHLPRGAVRFGQEDEVMMDRSDAMS